MPGFVAKQLRWIRAKITPLASRKNEKGESNLLELLLSYLVTNLQRIAGDIDRRCSLRYETWSCCGVSTAALATENS
ncbi:hypothetical protein Y032_0159g3289 [Ancylostoma ceylanicum]|uniref:Uncharacterized protein n=1 Tax=Ancylostoma ceylanicum TaxID=53326 RepID=A0A016SXL9_9BILA|nr:hypothetical protein Y032_0159g3289 [Ancylostoma ceylanicum]